MTDATKKTARRGVIVGAILAIVCHIVPPDYRALCDAVATICSGGMR